MNMGGRAWLPSGADVRALRIVSPSGAANIYAQTDVASLTDVWVRCYMKFVEWLPAPGGFGPWVLSIEDVGAFASADGIFIDGDVGPSRWWTKRSSNGPFATVTTGVWYLVDFRWAKTSPGTEELWIDDNDQGATVSGNNIFDATSVTFGLTDFSGDEVDHEVLWSGLMIGTTRGGAEIWSTTLTDLSDFTTTDAGDGTLEVVTVPGP